MTAIPFGIASGGYSRRFGTSAEAKEWFDNLEAGDPFFQTPLAQSALYTMQDLKREIERCLRREQASS